MQELLRFDCNASEGGLRIWDRVEGALVERAVAGETAESQLLACNWQLAPADELPRALRLQRDGQLLPTRLEATRQAKQAEQQAKHAEQRVRQQADARIAELEAALKRRG